MNIGVLTGGGDCPGLNAVIRAIVRKSEKGGDLVLGIRDGWKGLVEGMIEPLTPGAVAGVLPRGGTILGTSRVDPFNDGRDVVKCENNFRHHGLDGLIAVGGMDTLAAARRFHGRGLPVVGVPWTIENEIPGTDRTFGSDTALNVAVEAIDRLHSTAESHGRTIVVEVTGRDAGWLAAASAVAGGADVCLVPEEPFDVEAVCAVVRGRRERGKPFSVIVAAEGARPREGGPEGAGSIGAWIAEEVGKRVGVETRTVVLGPALQGGVPSASDRLIATCAGLRAVDLVRRKKFGRMVALSGSRWTDAPLPAAGREGPPADRELFRDAHVFFG